MIQGRIDKITALEDLATRLGLAADQCAYMGDDTIDASAIEWAGIGVAPREAMGAALAAADYITQRAAGHGAVREVCERLLGARVYAFTVIRLATSTQPNSAQAWSSQGNEAGFSRFIPIQPRHPGCYVERHRYGLILIFLLFASAWVRAQTPAPAAASATPTAPPAANAAPPPAFNWVLPIFTDKEGFRSLTLRGTEVRPAGKSIEVTDLSITIFSGDAASQVDSMLLSPSAVFSPKENQARGEKSVRFIRDDVEVTGLGWTYDHKAKKFRSSKTCA